MKDGHEKSPVGRKLFIALFTVFILPTAAFVAQHTYTHLRASPQPDDQAKPISITINNHVTSLPAPNPPTAAGQQNFASVESAKPAPQPAVAVPAYPSSALKDVQLLTLNTSPAQFDGQTVMVRADLCGTPIPGNIHTRLTVKGARTTADGQTMRADGINFVIPPSQTPVLMKGIQPGVFYPVRITVTVSQGGKGFWLANVSKIERWQ
jgi:hypothetical protein